MKNMEFYKRHILGDNMTAETIIPLVSALFGGVLVALCNHLLNRKKTVAEIERIIAETENIRIQSEQIKGSVEGVKTEQAHQENTIKEIQGFLVRHYISKDERMHLKKLDSKKYWEFQQCDSTEFFKNELRNLRSMDLIEGYKNKGIRSLTREGGDINTHFKITPDGRKYLEMWDQSNK